MKKALFFFAGLVAVSLAFVGCNKEADMHVTGKKTAELRLSTVDTRTVNDGMNTEWANGDTLTVFYAPTGTTTWSQNTRFTVSDPDSGLAKGDVELTADAYDWYLFYPYNLHIVNPTGKDDSGAFAGYFYVGSSTGGSQKQAGLNSMAHIAGERVPLVGRVTNVPVDQVPEVPMKHLSTLLKINVTNVYENPITIKKISFTAPTDIVGSAYLDFSGDEPQLYPSADHIGPTAKLTVNDAEPLASGETASFYLAVMPFTVKYGEFLSIEIEAAEGTHTADLSAPKNYFFEAGKMKNLNVDFEKADDQQTLTVADLITTSSAGQSFSGELVGATVTFVSGKNAFMQDDNNGILVYMTDHGLTAGDFVSGQVSGTGTLYKNLPEITTFNFSSAVSGTVPAPIELTLAQLLADYDSYISRYVKLTGVTATTAFSSRNATLADGDDTIVLRDQKSGLKIDENGTYDIIGFPSVYNDAKQMGVWLQENIIQTGSAGVQEGTITVPRTTLSLYVGDVRSLEATTNSTATITYASSDPSIASVDSEGNVTAVAAGETTITLTVAEVPGEFTAAEKEVTITVSPKSGEVDGTWVETALSSISNGAQIVIVASKDGQPNYAMSNDGSADKQPSAIEVTVSGSALSAVYESIVWTLEKSGSSYILHPGNNAAAWLYCIKNNNGLRIGVGESKAVSLDSSGYLTIPDTDGATRFIGVYYGNKDWRSYTSINNNIKDQTFTFYVKQ